MSSKRVVEVGREPQTGQFVRIDGAWFRSQAEQAVSTFLAPLVGAASAVADLTKPDMSGYSKVRRYRRRIPSSKLGSVVCEALSSDNAYSIKISRDVKRRKLIVTQLSPTGRVLRTREYRLPSADEFEANAPEDAAAAPVDQKA